MIVGRRTMRALPPNGESRGNPSNARLDFADFFLDAAQVVRRSVAPSFFSST